METRDQWYKPNLLYNIHWRPPKTPEPPKMIVKTVRFNPSVCTCGEHSCEPHYKMERKVVWLNKETTSTIEDTKKEDVPRKGLRSDQEVESKMNEVFQSKEEKVSDFKCKSSTNYKERRTEEEIYNREVSKESLCVGYGKRLEKDDNKKYDKSKGSSMTDGHRNIGSENVCNGDESIMKKEWLAIKKEDSCDGYQNDDSEIDMERKVEGNNSVSDIDVLKIKDHRDTKENMIGDYSMHNENLKHDCDGYFIRTDKRFHTESDKKCSDGDFRNRVVNDGGNCESKLIDVTLVRGDEKAGEKIGKDLKSNCEKYNGQTNCNLSTESIVRNDERCNDGETDDEERCNINSSDYSCEGCDEDVTEEIYVDEEISPAFGIMSIYCNSELHYSVLGLGA